MIRLAVVLLVLAAPASADGPGSRPLEIDATYTAAGYGASLCHQPENGNCIFGNGWSEGVSSAALSETIAIGDGLGRTMAGPVSITVSSRGGAVTVSGNVSTTDSAGDVGTVDIWAEGRFSYRVPDLGHALTTVLVAVGGAAGAWSAEPSLGNLFPFSGTILVQSEALALEDAAPLEIARLDTDGPVRGALVSLVPGDTVTFHIYGTGRTLEYADDPPHPAWSFSGRIGEVRVLTGSQSSDACRADLTGDGIVNFGDLAKMKAAFFQTCAP